MQGARVGDIPLCAPVREASLLVSHCASAGSKQTRRLPIVTFKNGANQFLVEHINISFYFCKEQQNMYVSSQNLHPMPSIILLLLLLLKIP